MTWLLLFAHSFNPIFLRLGSNQLARKPAKGRTPGAAWENAVGIVSASFILYLMWLGLHFLVLSVLGPGCNFHRFIGEGKDITYHLPFVLGFVMLVIEVVIRPGLTSKQALLFFNGLSDLLLFTGCYFMM